MTDKSLGELLRCGVLCNNASISGKKSGKSRNRAAIDGQWSVTGDPTEAALLIAAAKAGLTSAQLCSTWNIKEEIPFDSETRYMAVLAKSAAESRCWYKGAGEVILPKCSHFMTENGGIELLTPQKKKEIENIILKMSDKALRVLAMAYCTSDTLKSNEKLVFLGLAGMIDPPREEANTAIRKCASASVKSVMITGDHKITAIAIAKALGILENEDEAITGSELEELSDEDFIKNVRKYSVYARVSPEHKVRIVKAWQANGEIVAMTGDGVNDAPALKTADIGCAMGIVGTDVSKEAADVILTDDNFATIVSSVEEGRRIYDNILKAIQFLLSSNVGEIIILFVAILMTPLLSKWFNIDVNLITPLLPIHILWINLVTDSLPALALAVDPSEKDIMNRKPLKPKQGVFTKGMTFRVVYQGIMIGVITLIAFIIGLATPENELPVVQVTEANGIVRTLSAEEVKVEIGQAMAFTVLALSELVHVFNIRNNKKSIFKTGIFNNSKLILATVVSAGLMLVVLFIPALRNIFSIPVLPAMNILETVILVFMPIVVIEIFKLFKINTTKEE